MNIKKIDIEDWQQHNPKNRICYSNADGNVILMEAIKEEKALLYLENTQKARFKQEMSRFSRFN